jgi:hypothetical protein
VARAGWVRKAVKAPSNAPALAAWSPWDRRSQQGTGGCARSVGGAAGVATARDIARGRERLAPASCRILLGPVQLHFTPNFSTEVGQVVNSKVVDHLFLYNFYKGCRVFFSTIFAQIACQVGSFLCAGE